MLHRSSDAFVSYRRISARKWLEKFRNSFLQINWLWDLVVTEQTYQTALNLRSHEGKGLRWKILVFLSNPIFSRTRLLFGLAPIIWFWPQLSTELTWADANKGNSRDPELFRYQDTTGIFLCDTVRKYARSKDDQILELGCNAGRYLNYLCSFGYNNLTGVDISEYALEVMPRWFPDTINNVKKKHDLFQRYLPTVSDQSFDVVFTHGATIETTHPSFNIVKQISRVTKKHVVLYIREHEFFTRFWEHEFRKQGFVATYVIRPLDNFGAMKEAPPHPSHTTLFVFTRTNVNVAFNELA